MIKKIVCLIGLFLSPVTMGSLLESVEVKHVSSSGRSFVLSRGHLEGFREGLKAQFLSVTGPLDAPQIQKIGYGDLVKITPTESFWVLNEMNHSHRTKAGEKIRLIRQDLALQGLRTQIVRQRKVILSAGQRAEQVRVERQQGMPDELIYGDSDQYESIVLPLDKNNTSAVDLETTEYGNWSEKDRPEFNSEAMEELEVKFVSEWSNVGDADEIREEDQREVFRSYVDSFVDRINRQKVGLKSLYQKNLDEVHHDEVQYVVDKQNLYFQKLNPEAKEVSLQPHALQKIKRDGPLWSADLDDQQLRGFMVSSGIAQERRRQELSVSEGESHEVIFRANTSLVKNTNPDDPNFQNLSYGLSASYEYALQRIAPVMSSFTLDLEIFTSLNFYEMGEELNGRFQDSGFGGALNYYFYNGPFTVDRLTLYGGFGLKRSSASGSSEFLITKSSYNYQVLTLPSFHLGAKYRFPMKESYKKEFKVGYGLNALLSFERKELSVQEELEDPIYSSFSVNDTRLSIGMSFYF